MHQHPQSRCHPSQPFVQIPHKPSFALNSPSLDFPGQTAASYHLGFNNNLLSTTHSRVASSCQPLPTELGSHHYSPAGENGKRCLGMPDQNPWPAPTSAGRPPGIITGRPWTKAAGLTPEVFLPQPYNSFLLEHTDSSSNFSPDSEVFNPAALPTVTTPILTADAPHLRDQPQDLVAYFSGSESDSGQEPEDERGLVREARQDQWTSISTASPRAKSPATMTSSRRSASFVATEVNSAQPCLPHCFVLLSLHRGQSWVQLFPQKI